MVPKSPRMKDCGQVEMTVSSVSSLHMPTWFDLLCSSGLLSIVWKTGLPSKAVFLLCLVVLEKVLMVDKLKSRGFHMPNRCYMCCCNEETSQH